MDLAAASDGKISIYDVWDACDGLDLAGPQIDLVCAYLSMNHVEIEGYEASPESARLFRDAPVPRGANESSGSARSDADADEAREKEEKDRSEPDPDQNRARTQPAPKDKDLTGEESSYYQMYLHEIKEVDRYEPGEEEDLLEAMLSGDERAKERLIEGNLRLVVNLTREFLGQGVLAADLVQEGNVALFLAVEDYRRGMDFSRHVENAVRSALRRVIRQETGADDIAQTLAADANALMKATEDLAEDLGREATSQELASYLHMSSDRVESLVKMSLDAMNLPGSDGGEKGEEE